MSVLAQLPEVGNTVIVGVIVALGVPKLLLDATKARWDQAERRQLHEHKIQSTKLEQQTQQDNTAMALVDKLMTKSGELELEERRRTTTAVDRMTEALGGFRSVMEDHTVAMQSMQIRAHQSEPQGGLVAPRPLPAKPTDPSKGATDEPSLLVSDHTD